MKKQLNPRSSLTTVLLHEYRRASLAFQEFLAVAERLIGGDSKIQIRLATYDSYGRFIHHLFEYYKGCIETVGPKTIELKGVELDRRIQAETMKLMGHRAERIARGEGASWDNTEVYYREPVPAEFARDFRLVRNQLAHVSVERADPTRRVSLPDFFVRYHRFALLLYEEPLGLWQVKEESAVDWKEIERFDDALKLQYSGKPPNQHLQVDRLSGGRWTASSVYLQE